MASETLLYSICISVYICIVIDFYNFYRFDDENSSSKCHYAD